MSAAAQFMPRLRIVLLVVVLLLAGGYLAFSTWFRNQMEQEAVEFRENMLWAVFQIQKELQTTLRLSEKALAGQPVHMDDLEISYEIFVSRIDLAHRGAGFEDLRDIAVFSETIGQLMQSIAGLDKELATKPDMDAQTLATSLIQDLEPYEERLQQVSVATLHFASDRNTRRNAKITQMLNWMQALFVLNITIVMVAFTFAFQQMLKAYRSDYKAEQEERERHFLEETAERNKLQALGTLAGGVAHEINTPAQFVMSNLEFLHEAFNHTLRSEGGLSAQEEDEDTVYYREEVPAALSQSVEGMRRIGEIVKAIRHFAHTEDGSEMPVDIAGEIKNALILTTSQTKHVATVTSQVPENLPTVTGRTNELNQVLINLIVNAAQAIEEKVAAGYLPPGDGLIEVNAVVENGSVVIRVADNGPGIPVEIENQIFDPFFTTKPVGVGSGQGLAISRKIIASTFGGSIAIDRSGPPGGCFVIRLPLPECDTDSFPH